MSINITCPVNQLGYGVVSLNILKALDAIGAEPAAWFLGPVEAPPEDHELLNRLSQRTQAYSNTAPSLRIYHQFDLAQHVGWGVHIGFPIFELTRFKTNELHHLGSQDGLVVCSQWAKQVLKNADWRFMDKDIFVVPLGVDRDIFRPQQVFEQGQISHELQTRFFNCGKWEYRKGHDVLCEAFNKAFEPNDNVALFLNCHNPCFQDQQKYLAYNKQWTDYYKNSKLGDKISISPSRLPRQQQVAELMRSMDCGVFPARAEGWNLELSEMLAMGKHVIATNYSAHTEFCTGGAARLVEPSHDAEGMQLEDAHDGIWFNADDPEWRGTPGQWLRFGDDQMDQLVEHLRTVHRHKQEGNLGVNQAGIDAMAPFTWKATASKLVDNFII